MRLHFFEAWRKFRAGSALDGLEAVIVHIINQHPEYHALLDKPELYRDKDYLPETGQTNPFLHLGLHIALSEQLSTNRPQGVQAIYQALSQHSGDQHMAEHRMIDCLAEILWTAQRNGVMPEESTYLASLRKLL